MKKIFYVLLMFSGFLNAQNFVWAERIGGEGEDVTRSMSVDGEGNTYVTGYFTDTSYFGSGSHEAEVISNGSFDVFVSKTSPDGELLWVKTFGSDLEDYGTGINADAEGVYVTGVYQNTVDFNPEGESSALTSTGYLDIFMLKLDVDGNFQWVKSIGNTGYEESTAIDVDADGNVYVGGYFYGIMDFDPSEAEFEMEPVSIGDGFILKLNNEGNFQWAKQIAGGFSLLLAMEVLDDGQIYAVGNFQQSCDFDPNPESEHIVTAGQGSMDIFVLRLDNMGDFINVATTKGDNGISTTVDVAVDNEGNAYVTGYFGGIIDFAPNMEHGGEHTYSTNEFLNCYVFKTTQNGEFGWVKHITAIDAEGTSNGYGVAVNSSGESFLSGYFSNTVSFGDTALSQQSNEAMDAFIAKLDSAGNFVYARAIGGANFVEEHGVRLDNSGNIYIVGTFENTVDVDPNPNQTHEFVSRGFRDTYILKYADSELGLNEMIAQNEIQIYPNPSNGTFFINSKNALNGKQFKIYDLTGKLISSGLINQKQELNLSNLNQGIYILKIDNKFSFKIIKK
ncbi:T9SS type A sorting domain-containing protein [Moheibacter sediminis]|uniref:Por secretion system C-terminal sorting domain-containing protein n=1 Tax=Moheibacter sediminis TaxID=1434700 RepID=A0A1W2CHP7_9FLAO|nr:T9SS type A sorting domain-containing protein [Moheibacter sediminis]SMC84158.1 Por secretion system C-terminal sorting domain-containing protein [Moheibacter sediminis]